jgi:hypothetical protein
MAHPGPGPSASDKAGYDPMSACRPLHWASSRHATMTFLSPLVLLALMLGPVEGAPAEGAPVAENAQPDQAAPVPAEPEPTMSEPEPAEPELEPTMPEPELTAEPGLESEAIAEPEPEPAPDPEPASSIMASLVGYSAAVQLHLEGDPARAAAYIAFWQALTAAGEPGALDEAAVARAQAAGESIAQMFGAPRQPGAAPYRLVDLLELSLGARAGGKRAIAAPETLLGMVDQVLAPRVLVNGRYEFAGTLTSGADLGFAPDVWLRCKDSPACVTAHDALFSESMGGVSLVAGLGTRLARDAGLEALAGLPQLLDGVQSFDARLEAGGATVAQQARLATTEYWQALAAQMAPSLAGTGTGTVGGEGTVLDPLELGAMLALGRASAWLGESPRAAASFGVIRGPLTELGMLSGAGAAGGTFIAATAGVGLLLAGMHALALFDAGVPPRELERMVAELQDSAYRNFVALRAEGQLASNLLDARLVRLGLALDVVKDDVSRIESTQRARLRSEFLAEDARRWTGFEEDNDRCFSLRQRDPRTGQLRAAEFRRCEERFLQGAVRRSQYVTRARDFVLDARYLEAADLRFPFRHHYPLLLTLGGMDASAALALSDPFEWQQHAAALLRLYQENPAGPGDGARRAEALRSLRAAGARVHDALVELAVQRTGTQPAAFREDVHARTFDEYLGSLQGLMRRIAALDDPEADPHGKRLTMGLDQALPDGARRAAMETVLSAAREGATGLAPCASVPDAAFLAEASGLHAESRRFFGSPVTAEEVARSWNREAIAGFGAAPASYAALVPRPYLWATLDGHGEIELCLAKFRPRVLEFTREESGQRNHFLGRVELDAVVEVRFRPAAETARALGLDASRPQVVVGEYEASRKCTFGYRADNEGCSRGECLAELGPRFWGADAKESLNGGACEGDPLPVQLARRNSLEGAGELEDLGKALAAPHWSGRAAQRARLAADARRSSEFETASANYLRYFALAGLTLGAWPDPSQPLAPLFTDDDPLSPRAIVTAMVEQHLQPQVLEAELARRRAHVLIAVAERGREVASSDALYRLPHYSGLRETLGRVDLALAAYR